MILFYIIPLRSFQLWKNLNNNKYYILYYSLEIFPIMAPSLAINKSQGGEAKTHQYQEK